MESPIAEIKPNIKKAFISNILLVLAILSLIIGSLIYLNIIVGLDIFLDTFKEIGMDVSASSFLLLFIFLILFFTTLLLTLNYVNLGKISYTLYKDKIVYSKSFFIMQVSGKTIPYSNITKINYKKKSFLDTAKVTLELTGMKESRIDMEFIDNPEEVVRGIQGLIREYRSKYYAKYSQEYRFQNIMDGL